MDGFSANHEAIDTLPAFSANRVRRFLAICKGLSRSHFRRPNVCIELGTSMVSVTLEQCICCAAEALEYGIS